MKETLIILLISALAFSCSNKSDNQEEAEFLATLPSTDQSQIELDDKISKSEVKPVVYSTFEIKDLSVDPEDLKLSFNDFELVIHNFSVLPSRDTLKNDTLNIFEDIGFSLENHTLQIIPKDSSDKFKIYFAVEQNLTAYLGEKSYKDLEQWKKIGKYSQLMDTSKFYFQTPKYGSLDKRLALNSEIDKIKEEVLKLKGEYITEELKSARSFNDLPIEFWISRVFLKIIRTDLNGTSSQTVLINNSSWGC